MYSQIKCASHSSPVFPFFSFSRHIGIASDRIRKRHVWHILSAKAKPKFNLPKNKLKQQIRKRKSFQTFFPSFLPSLLSFLADCPLGCCPISFCRCLHTCRMRNFDLIDFVEQLLFALRWCLTNFFPKLLMHQGRVFFNTNTRCKVFWFYWCVWKSCEWKFKI